MKSSVRPSLGLALAGACALLLAGCGDGTGGVKPINMIYTSVLDCTEHGKADFDRCTRAIDRAVSDHIKTSPKYVTLGDCEAVEGYERCEKHAERVYRPRIMAYYVTLGPTSTLGKPLYPGLKGVAALRNGEGTVYDPQRTEGVTFTAEALIKVAGLFVDQKTAKANKKKG